MIIMKEELHKATISISQKNCNYFFSLSPLSLNDVVSSSRLFREKKLIIFQISIEKPNYKKITKNVKLFLNVPPLTMNFYLSTAD